MKNYDNVDLTGLKELTLAMGAIEERLYQLDQLAIKHMQREATRIERYLDGVIDLNGGKRER